MEGFLGESALPDFRFEVLNLINFVIFEKTETDIRKSIFLSARSIFPGLYLLQKSV